MRWEARPLQGATAGEMLATERLTPAEPVHKQTFEFAALTRAIKLHKWFRICFPKLPLFLCCKKKKSSAAQINLENKSYK